MGLFLAFVDVSMGEMLLGQREREKEGRRQCVKMTEEVWANTDARPCVCFLACSEERNKSRRQVSV